MTGAGPGPAGALLVGLVVGLAVLVWPVRSGAPGSGRGRGHPRRGVTARWVRAVSTALARWRGAGADRRARMAELQVLDGLAAALEAGLPVSRAVQLAVGGSDPGGAWEQLAGAAAEGRQLGAAWTRLARQTGSPTLASVSRAWRVAELTGAPLAAALRVSAHAGRERARLTRALQVAVAGPRATVAVLTALPLAGVGLAAVLGVGPAALYGHPVAHASVGTGAVLLLAGQVWVRRLVATVLGGSA
ncbi:type II secretion system F family protein [Ornithinimicrobium flavum]|uniref:type II secretion system F family protein n=1 Tax=Ornithinimicrobium flavum TaxID=1288636 RepID=UPI00106F40E4|nr:type II secretion system F family protein [Ornithinimicrobium flavum]